MDIKEYENELLRESETYYDDILRLKSELENLISAKTNISATIVETGNECLKKLRLLASYIPNQLGYKSEPTFTSEPVQIYDLSRHKKMTFKVELYFHKLFSIYCIETGRQVLRERLDGDFVYGEVNNTLLITQLTEHIIPLILKLFYARMENNISFLKEEISNAKNDIDFVSEVCGIPQDENWEKYILYLAHWTSMHADKSNQGQSPLSYNEWVKGE